MIIDAPELKALAERQFGLVSHHQITELGFTALAVRETVHTGRWRRVLPKVYLTEPGELDLDQQRTAAGLYTAGMGQLTGLAALTWHGLANLPVHDTLTMLVPHQMRRVPSDFVDVRRTRHLDTGARLAGTYHVCGIARATADACRGLTDLDTVQALIAQVIGVGATTVTGLRVELARAGSSRTRPLRLALKHFTG